MVARLATKAIDRGCLPVLAFVATIFNVIGFVGERRS